VPPAGFEPALTAPEGNAVHGPDLVNAPPTASWGSVWGVREARILLYLVEARPPADVSAGHPLRDAYQARILPP